MEKLFVFFVIALVANGAFGQGQDQQNEDELDDRYGFNRPGWNRPNWNQFPGQFPNQNQFPGQFPNQNQFPGQFPNQNQFPGQFPTVRPTTAPTTLPTPGGSTTQSPAVRACISSCPVTAEYNPVCGTDNTTYTNPGRLSCAQLCGVNVSLLRASPCPTAPPLVPAA